MLIGGLFFCLGAALVAAAQDLAMLIVGRICLGIGVGFANQVRGAALLSLEVSASCSGYHQ
jgi:predicted MFS family arabinose efflux permease